MGYSKKVRERMRFQGVRGSKKYPKKHKIRIIAKRLWRKDAAE